MKIPKKITLIARDIEIVIDENLRHDHNNLGLYEHDKARITLCEKGGKKSPRHLIEQTLLHELMHAIFLTLGYNEMGENEQLVDQISELWYQLIPQLQEKK